MPLEVKQNVVHFDVAVDDFSVMHTFDSVDQVEHELVILDGRGRVSSRTDSPPLINKLIESFFA